MYRVVEEKAKVVAAVWGEEFIQYVAASARTYILVSVVLTLSSLSMDWTLATRYSVSLTVVILVLATRGRAMS